MFIGAWSLTSVCVDWIHSRMFTFAPIVYKSELSFWIVHSRQLSCWTTACRIQIRATFLARHAVLSKLCRRQKVSGETICLDYFGVIQLLLGNSLCINLSREFETMVPWDIKLLKTTLERKCNECYSQITWSQERNVCFGKINYSASLSSLKMHARSKWEGDWSRIQWSSSHHSGSSSMNDLTSCFNN